jgi:hypothetical protein
MINGSPSQFLYIVDVPVSVVVQRKGGRPGLELWQLKARNMVMN